TFGPHKALHRVEAEAVAEDGLCRGCPAVGYEVHQGRSERRAGVRPWLRLRRQPGGAEGEDGAVGRRGRVCGTYVHGLFDAARFCRSLVDTLRRRRGLAPLTEDDWLAGRAAWARRHDHLAGWLTAHCDLGPVARALGL